MLKTPVLVVGAGLSGLSTALYLGLHGVPALLVEQHSTTSTQPKARGQFPHVMEALKLAGVDQLMVRASPPSDGFRIIVAPSLTAPPVHEIMIGAGPDLSALSAAGWADASQERAEPILAARAGELGADIRFNTQLDSFEQDTDGVTAVLRDLVTDATTAVRADYLVAADGHRSPILKALGIGSTGRGVLGESTGVLFDAELPHGRILYYLQNPDLPGGGGVLVSTDEPNRYALGVGLTDIQPDWTEVIRTATGLPELTPTLVSTSSANYTATTHRVADRFSSGRVHLVGDAVRVMPPTGAFGGNTAIMDGFSLAWKLAAVVTGQAGAGLLDSHDPERRPYSQILADQQYAAFVQRMRPGTTDETVATAIDPVSTLFFGYRQISSAVVLEDGDAGEPLENPEQPTGRPGSRASHVILVDGSGAELSTIDLFGRSFVLLTGSRGHDWLESGAKVATALGIDLPVHRIGVDFADPSGSWAATYGVHEDGAVLVRPDFFVAWRSIGAAETADLERALRAVLDRG